MEGMWEGQQKLSLLPSPLATRIESEEQRVLRLPVRLLIPPAVEVEREGKGETIPLAKLLTPPVVVICPVMATPPIVVTPPVVVMCPVMATPPIVVTPPVVMIPPTMSTPPVFVTTPAVMTPLALATR